MPSAIAEKHTLELGAHQPCTQSLEKVNLDISKSNNSQSNNIQRLKLDRLRNSTWTQATTLNIVLQKSWKKAQKSCIMHLWPFGAIHQISDLGLSQVWYFQISDPGVLQIGYRPAVCIGYRPRWRSADIWRTDRGEAEVRSPDIRPATEDDIRHNAPELVEENHLKTLVFRFWVTQEIAKPRQAVTLTGKTNTMSFSEPSDCMWKPF